MERTFVAVSLVELNLWSVSASSRVLLFFVDLAELGKSTSIQMDARAQQMEREACN